MTQPSNRPNGANVLVLPNAESAARKAAELFAESAATAIGQRGVFHVALAGGTTPKTMYAMLAGDEQFAGIHWPKVRIWFTDERCVPPTDPASNYNMVNETLLRRVNVCPNCVHRMEGELTSVPAADCYEQAIRDHLLDDGGRFDLVLLGMGADGHTASLFPDTEAVGVTDVWCFGNEVPALDDERVTLTFPAINSARRIVFLVTGPTKADAAMRVFGDPVAPSTLPAQAVKPSDGELIWVLDAAAAGGLS